MEQGTDEWFAARCGKATASKIHSIIAKGGKGAEKANYEALLIGERLTGRPHESFKSHAMEWGNEKEPEAVKAYEFAKNLDVQLVGFVDHPKIKNSGASPDGLVGEDGIVQFKCPNTATHIATVLGGIIKAPYRTQVQWEMACTNRQWCDFVSYDPRLSGSGVDIHIKRVPRDDQFIISLEGAVANFLSQIDSKVKELQALGAAA